MRHAAAALVAACLVAGSLGAQQPRDSAAAGRDSASHASHTQQPQSPVQPRSQRRASPWLPRLRLDNDAYNFWLHPGHRTDEEYTNGVVATLVTLRGSFWGGHLAPRTPDCGADTSREGRCRLTTVSIGQDMYTPNLLRPPHANPDWEDERPYAGWLWLGAAAQSVSRRSSRTLEAQLGVTGPPALGQVSQKVAHLITSDYTTRATGWDTQVGFQPGLQLAYTHALLAARGSIGSKGVIDLVPVASATLGTVRTAADVGGKLRIGYNLSHPFDPRAWPGRTPLEYWVSAGGRAMEVAHDFSLDGALGGGRHVTRVPGVREYTFGAGLRMHRLLLQWEATTRTRQYTTGPLHHTFSGMTATWEFYR